MITHNDHQAAVQRDFEARATYLPTDTAAARLIKAAVLNMPRLYRHPGLIYSELDGRAQVDDEQQVVIWASIALDRAITDGEDTVAHTVHLLSLALTPEENDELCQRTRLGMFDRLSDALMHLAGIRYGRQIGQILLEVLPVMRAHAANDPEYPKSAEAHRAWRKKVCKEIYDKSETNG